jgi:hypothetical protein
MRPLDREFPTTDSLAGATPEERWLLGEPLPAFVEGRIASRWWLPTDEDISRMSRFSRDADRNQAIRVVKYD